MKRVCSMASVALMCSIAVAGARAQEPTPDAVRIPVEVEIVISRFEDDKRVSSVPYLLAVNAASSLAEAPETSLNMGSEVPVPTTTFSPINAPGTPATTPIRSFNYRSIGTSITGSAARAGGGLFELRLAIDDTSIYTSGTAKSSEPVIAEMPVFRSFQTRNTLLIRDGQTRQFTAATDRVSGEVVRVDVTLRVVK